MKGKTEKIILFSGVLLIVVLLFLIVWNAGIFGISKSRVEQDARENQKIDSSWQLSQATNENMCAMLFYDETTNNCVYSIYLKRDGFSGMAASIRIFRTASTVSSMKTEELPFSP